MTMRRRNPHTSGTVTETMEQKPASSGGLSASNLLKASPSQMGPAMKLHIPLIYNFLPTFIAKICGSICLCLNIMPSWKQRYLIQLGGYLYKFKSDASSQPKGSPLAVDEIDVYAVDNMKTIIPDIPPSSTEDNLFFFCISTLYKRQYYAVSTREDLDMWITTLRQTRGEHITRKMGHANHVPYPYEYFDGMARRLAASKKRIRQKLQETNMREMELTSLGGGSYMPRGGSGGGGIYS